MTIQETLFTMQDLQYRDFQVKLIPNIPPESVIGVRTPELRTLAKMLSPNDAAKDFLSALPHRYFEENQLHAFLISEMKSYDAVIGALERFLPYIDNWATCDQLRPKVFRKHTDKLLPEIWKWLGSGKTYTVRFAVGMLMCHYLDEHFQPEHLDWAADIRSGEYYINMMIAWYFATALAKQYEAALPYLERGRLDTWVHNKTIQKARESFRVPDGHKAYLNTLKK